MALFPRLPRVFCSGEARYRYSTVCLRNRRAYSADGRKSQAYSMGARSLNLLFFVFFHGPRWPFRSALLRTPSNSVSLLLYQAWTAASSWRRVRSSRSSLVSVIRPCRSSTSSLPAGGSKVFFLFDFGLRLMAMQCRTCSESYVYQESRPAARAIRWSRTNTSPWIQPEKLSVRGRSGERPARGPGQCQLPRTCVSRPRAAGQSTASPMLLLEASASPGSTVCGALRCRRARPVRTGLRLDEDSAACARPGGLAAHLP